MASDSAKPLPEEWGTAEHVPVAELARRQGVGPVKSIDDLARCLANDLPLATFNTKDFADYAEHDGLRLIGNESR
jgi:hypothetical protein